VSPGSTTLPSSRCREGSKENITDGLQISGRTWRFTQNMQDVQGHAVRGGGVAQRAARPCLALVRPWVQSPDHKTNKQKHKQPKDMLSTVLPETAEGRLSKRTGTGEDEGGDHVATAGTGESRKKRQGPSCHHLCPGPGGNL
jgi:hypothetical protein